MPRFNLHSDFKPAGDQPQAIEQLIGGLRAGHRDQTLLGVTGSGKTFTMANVVEAVQKPTLVLAHKKTRAAQLAAEFRDFFPENAVQYFVSYYDYYQPEAYVPQSDTYIEKDADINEEIDKLRHAATMSLLTRPDALIVASVSCIYGLGSPTDYENVHITLKKGEPRDRDKLLRQLIDLQYERNEVDFRRGRFRVKGDVVEIFPAYEDFAYKLDFFGDEVEKITAIDYLTGELLDEKDELHVFPASHWVTTPEKLPNATKQIERDLEIRLKELADAGKVVEAERLKSRTNYDLEMIRETGFCSGIENYSRYLAGRKPGERPSCLLDYFPDDYLMFVDESHMTIPQVGAMYEGDRSRKGTLVDFGFRLPSAMDNRPLRFSEFERLVNQAVYVSATPKEYELSRSKVVAEQVVRPTGLLDPPVEVRPTEHQVDDLLAEIKRTVKDGQRVLVTTLTKKMTEDLSEYLREAEVKVTHLHADIETFERTDILRSLRAGEYDVVVGINLLREGLDLPEVSLVAILDADKEGFLRSDTSLIQTMGRAARHVDGRVIMYADKITDSMKRAIAETDRRRQKQEAYNKKHGITPTGIKKKIAKAIRSEEQVEEHEIAEILEDAQKHVDLPPEQMQRYLHDLKVQMEMAAENLEFEKAAALRDRIAELKKKSKHTGAAK
ncbi:MAG: excinuclease ABC subunit UvrB [Patescibacteria group bacterium]|nr:excinuclease ABC subunit UvrB [Patescibacteria group bacterium]